MDIESVVFGELAEWSIAAVLKTVEVRASGGSNPSLSAPKQLVAQQQAAFFIATSENLFSEVAIKKAAEDRRSKLLWRKGPRGERQGKRGSESRASYHRFRGRI